MDKVKCSCKGANLPKLLKPALLSMLTREPMHGYAVAHALNSCGVFGRDVDLSGVYRAIKELEADGRVSSSLRECGEGPARKVCRITASGRRCLENWRASLESYRDQISKTLEFMERGGRDESV